MAMREMRAYSKANFFVSFFFINVSRSIESLELPGVTIDRSQIEQRT